MSDDLVCPKCGAPDSVVACDDRGCPGTAVPRAEFRRSSEDGVPDHGGADAGVREALTRLVSDPGDGTVAPDLAHVLSRGFHAMGWSNPQCAAEDMIDAILAALSKPAPVDANASAEAECTDCGGTGVTYQTERPCSCNASAEERLREALEPFAVLGRGLYEANQRSDQSVLIGASAEFLNLRPLIGQHFVNAHLALSAHPHASDCDKQGETTKSEGGGESRPAGRREPSPRGGCWFDSSTPGWQRPGAGVAPGPSDRTADVTERDLRSFIYVRQPIASGQLARALLRAFTVGRR